MLTYVENLLEKEKGYMTENVTPFGSQDGLCVVELMTVVT